MILKSSTKSLKLDRHHQLSSWRRAIVLPKSQRMLAQYKFPRCWACLQQSVAVPWQQRPRFNKSYKSLNNRKWKKASYKSTARPCSLVGKDADSALKMGSSSTLRVIKFKVPLTSICIAALSHKILPRRQTSQSRLMEMTDHFSWEHPIRPKLRNGSEYWTCTFKYLKVMHSKL